MPISTWTDRSGTIAATGVAQTASPGTTARSGFTLQNNDASNVMWFNVGVTAVAASPSIRIASLGLYETPPFASPQGPISIIGTIAGTYTLKEWKNI